MANEYSKRRKKIFRRVSILKSNIANDFHMLTRCFDIFKLIHKLVDDTNAVKMVKIFISSIYPYLMFTRWLLML